MNKRNAGSKTAAQVIRATKKSQRKAKRRAEFRAKLDARTKQLRAEIEQLKAWGLLQAAKAEVKDEAAG
jgi:hypothetical protein